MSHFLLVHGSWHGAWCWREVTQSLIRSGHRAHAVTLTGVGERSHLLRRGIDLFTHIQDVISAIEFEELQDVVLVVHSYAGMVGTGVADKLGHERISHLVYVDAVVPKPGEAWSSTHSAATRQARMAAAQASELFSFPAPGADLFGLSGEQAEWVNRRQTPQPAQPYLDILDFSVERVAKIPRTFISCINPKLATIDAIRPRISDSNFWNGLWQPNARIIEMNTGHDPMISEPDELCSILKSCALIR
jgi:pimeloyl-ACP methyl ester carboxylesterase